MDINKLLGETEENDKPSKWDEVIQPKSSYLVLGDMDTGKSGLSYWLLERFAQKYNLTPTAVGIQKEKRTLLPGNFAFLDSVDECTKVENAIIFIDEADLQLPMDNQKLKQYVVNFLSLPFHRNQIFIMAFHYPRLVMGTYLPFFRAFLLKRPPYLLEFASKGQSKAIMGMMQKAEERFTEIPVPEDIVKYTYIVAPRLRWQGMVDNPLPSFWTNELRSIWAGVNNLSPAVSATQQNIEPPPQLSPDEAGFWQLQPLLPDYPQEQIMAIEAKWSKKQLQDIAEKNNLRPTGDKAFLVKKLLYISALPNLN